MPPEHRALSSTSVGRRSDSVEFEKFLPN
ncbi:hypothetical protein G210_5054 [Candida maltosa Xu316]|uniref:Uncharacterized protein n=1 Tax=Candida maltosa (strain Xu316) TaxID=1245528 RepID=M3JCP1_CANMX|nr:hypothetical protein G210_5054 [Candida maltosa Xu316]